MEFTYDLGKECRLLRIRLNQGKIPRFDDETNRQTGKSGTGANVGQPTFLNLCGGYSKKTLSEVKSQDFIGVSYRSERYFLVPLQKQGYVRPYLIAEITVSIDAIDF